MTIERAFRVAHNLDVSEAKRKHWPQWAVVVVRSGDEVADVIQFFEQPTEEEQYHCLEQYSKSMSFTVRAGKSHASLEEFEVRVKGTADLVAKLMTR